MPCTRCSNRRDKLKRAVTYIRDRMRRAAPKPTNATTKAIRSQDAKAQHAARRGYAIKPGTEPYYKRAINRMGKQGVPLTERWAILRGDYGVG